MLQENSWPSDALSPLRHAGSKQPSSFQTWQSQHQHWQHLQQQQLPTELHKDLPGAGATREFGTPVDGSPQGGIVASSHAFLSNLQVLQSLPSYRSDQRRKRPADHMMIFDEGLSDGTLERSASSSSDAVPVGRPASPPSPNVVAMDEDASPVSPQAVDIAEDQENVPPDAAVSGPRSIWPGQHRHREERVLQELRSPDMEDWMRQDVDVEVSDELEDDSAEEGGSLSDFETEGLAGILERRIIDNADGMYDFEIFIDP